MYAIGPLIYGTLGNRRVGLYVWSAPLTSATVRRVGGESVGAAVDSGATLHGPGGVWKGWGTGAGERAVHGAVMAGLAWLDTLVYIVSLILVLLSL
jgi:hypothetical protein